MQPEPITILMADDDLDDQELTRKAFRANHLAGNLRFVEDGRELLDYLRGLGKYAEPGSAPAPGLVLLDLNMPGMDGREALKEIKEDPTLRKIPVVVLTTSRAEEDVIRTYQLGCNSFVTKPMTLSGLIEVVRCLGWYWLDVVELPLQAA